MNVFGTLVAVSLSLFHTLFLAQSVLGSLVRASFRLYHMIGNNKGKYEKCRPYSSTAREKLIQINTILLIIQYFKILFPYRTAFAYGVIPSVQ